MYKLLLRMAQESDPITALNQFISQGEISCELKRELLDVSQADWKFILPSYQLSRVGLLGGGPAVISSIAKSCSFLHVLGVLHEESSYVRMFAECEGKKNIHSIYIGNEYSLPFIDSTLDLAVLDWTKIFRNNCVTSSSIVRYKESLIRECGRVVKRGGGLVVIDKSPVGDWLLRLRHRLFLRKSIDNSQNAVSDFAWQLSKYRQLLPQFGFSNYRTYCLYPSASSFDWIIPIDCLNAWLAISGPDGLGRSRWFIALLYLLHLFGAIKNLVPAYLIYAERV